MKKTGIKHEIDTAYRKEESPSMKVGKFALPPLQRSMDNLPSDQKELIMLEPMSGVSKVSLERMQGYFRADLTTPLKN